MYCELSHSAKSAEIGDFLLNFLLGCVGVVEVLEAEESVAQRAFK